MLLLASNPRWLLLTLAGLLCAGASARAEETVEVTVVAIVATERNADVNPRLREVARKIRNVDPKLTGFRLGRTTRRHLTIGTRETFPLIDCQEAEVTVRKGCGKDGKVELTIKPPLVGEVTYTTCCSKYFPMMTRYRTKDNDRLFIAVMVQPCKGKKQK